MAIDRQKHTDSHFAAATVNYLKDLAVTLGPGPVFSSLKMINVEFQSDCLLQTSRRLF